MCRYAYFPTKVHWVCVPCRYSAKDHPNRAGRRCPRCQQSMHYAGHDFAAPRRSNDSAWAVVADVLGAGLAYDGFERCGCGREPKFRPRTKSQVKARMRKAAREGVSPKEALAAVDVDAIRRPASL
jgi:hypothetical protein